MRRSRNAPIKKEFAGSEVSGSAIFILPDSFGVLLQPLGFDKLIFLHPERRAVAAVELVRLANNFGAHFQKYSQRHIPSVSVHLRSPQSKQCTQNPAQQVGAQMAVPKARMNGKASYMRSFRFFPGYDPPPQSCRKSLCTTTGVISLQECHPCPAGCLARFQKHRIPGSAPVPSPPVERGASPSAFLDSPFVLHDSFFIRLNP